MWSLTIRTLSLQETVGKDVAVYCCRQMVIPTNGTVNFKGRAGAQSGITSGILEQAVSLPSGIMLIKAAVNPDEVNKVHVMLKNVTAKSI